MPEMTSEIEQIGPDEARQYLQQNLSVRLLGDGHVRDLAAQMTGGRWRCTGETLKFDGAGNLIDGQHRLHAVILSGMTVSFLVVRGVEEGSFAVIDQGRKRYVRQFLGGKYADQVATAARYLWQIEQHLGYDNSQNVMAWSRLDIAEQKAYAESWPELVAWAPQTTAISRRTSVVQVPSRLLLPVVAQAARTQYAHRVESFLVGLHDGASAADPRMVLRKRLLASDNIGAASSWTDVGYSLVVKCWNAYVEGAVIKQLKMVAGVERRAVVTGSAVAAEWQAEPVAVSGKKAVLKLVA